MASHEPATKGTSAFVVTATGGRGLSYGQTRSSKFTAPYRSLRVPTHDHWDLHHQCEALQLILPPESAFVGTTAAAILGMPLPPWVLPGLDSSIEVAYPPTVGRRAISGIRHRKWLPDDSGTLVVNGVRVLSAARTWCDLAAMIPRDYLLAVGDHIVRHGLTTRTQLRKVIIWSHRRRGVVAARELVDLIDSRAESPPESRVRYWLRFHGLATPAVNADIVNGGSWIARGDLVFFLERVVVEYDGLVHLDEKRRRYDAKRRNLLQQAGWTVVVLTADDLLRPYEMSQTVRLALEQARRRR